MLSLTARRQLFFHFSFASFTFPFNLPMIFSITWRRASKPPCFRATRVIVHPLYRTLIPSATRPHDLAASSNKLLRNHTECRQHVPDKRESASARWCRRRDVSSWGNSSSYRLTYHRKSTLDRVLHSHNSVHYGAVFLKACTHRYGSLSWQMIMLDRLKMGAPSYRPRSLRDYGVQDSQLRTSLCNRSAGDPLHRCRRRLCRSGAATIR